MGNTTRIGIFGLVLLGVIAVIGLPGGGEEEPAKSTEAAATPAGELDMDVISAGEEVDIEAHLQPGTTTLIEFTAEW